MNRARWPLMALIPAMALAGCSGGDGTPQPEATATISYADAAALAFEYKNELFHDLNLGKLVQMRDWEEVNCPSPHPVGERIKNRYYLITGSDDERRYFFAVKKWLGRNGFSGITDTSKQSDGETVGTVSGHRDGVRISMHWNDPGDELPLASQFVTVVGPCGDWGAGPDEKASESPLYTR